MDGWIKLHRKITDNFLYFSEKFNRMQAFIDLLLLAHHKGNTVFIRGIEIKLNPGELCYSQESLARRWKWNRKTVSKYLDYISKENMISFRTTRLTTIIKIVNWEYYQIENDFEKKFEKSQNNGHQKCFENDLFSKDSGAFDSIDGQQNGHQKDNRTDTNKNDNNDKNIIYTNVFNYWNSKGIIIHRKLDEITKRKIKTSLSNYSLEEIKTAIDNYSYILNGKDFFFNYKWNLKDFLSRGIEKFINREIAENNYRNRTFNDNPKTKDELPNNESLTNRILL